MTPGRGETVRRRGGAVWFVPGDGLGGDHNG